MDRFALIAGLAFLFVIGAALAMRPSARDAQLARLRGAAIASGLRVRIAQAAESASGKVSAQRVVYVLPWRLEQLEAGRALGFAVRLDACGAWRTHPGESECGPQLQAHLRAFPAGVDAVHAASDGLCVRWDERGAASDVEQLASVLLALREMLMRGSASAGRT